MGPGSVAVLGLLVPLVAVPFLLAIGAVIGIVKWTSEKRSEADHRREQRNLGVARDEFDPRDF